MGEMTRNFCQRAPSTRTKRMGGKKNVRVSGRKLRECDEEPVRNIYNKATGDPTKAKTQTLPYPVSSFSLPLSLFLSVSLSLSYRLASKTMRLGQKQ